MPVEQAVKTGALSQAEWNEGLSGIIFFTLAYVMGEQKRRKAMGEGAASVAGGSTTSLKPMEFAASLQTSTAAESTPAETSSQPSSAG